MIGFIIFVLCSLFATFLAVVTYIYRIRIRSTDFCLSESTINFLFSLIPIVNIAMFIVNVFCILTYHFDFYKFENNINKFIRGEK